VAQANKIFGVERTPQALSQQHGVGAHLRVGGGNRGAAERAGCANGWVNGVGWRGVALGVVGGVGWVGGWGGSRCRAEEAAKWPQAAASQPPDQ
jgi:hypothetical protein